ncbi:unnamed protein product, partial [Ectocarpus sp. 4 AP-2014]
YTVVDVGGGGLCGLLAPIALNLFAAGIPVEDIILAVKDNITDDMKDYVQSLRGKVVEMSRGRFTFADGKELADIADVVKNPKWVILTREMWERVILFSTGYFEGRAVVIMGKVLRLDGLRIVEHKNGILAPCDAGEALPRKHCPMVLHDGSGHFKALVSFRDDPQSEASGSTNVESDASDGTDGEES